MAGPYVGKGGLAEPTTFLKVNGRQQVYDRFFQVAEGLMAEGSALENLNTLPNALQIIPIEDAPGVIAVDFQSDKTVPIPIFGTLIDQKIIYSFRRYIDPVEPSMPSQPYAEVEVAWVILLSVADFRGQVQTCQ